MSHLHYIRSQASSSPLSSSSQSDIRVDAFFAPEYPTTDIKTWRSGLKTEVPLYYQEPDTSSLHQNFLFDTAALYHPHGTVTEAATRPVLPSGVPSASRVGKRGSQDSTPDVAAMSVVEDFAAAHPPTKRSRKETPTNGRVSGACTRCKRLKMKCTFADSDTTCARCIVGGHECVVLGRKPRSPGMREILRKQIREKDAQIDSLLAQLNPAASTATPLALNVAKLALTPEQRAAHRDVLAYFEKSQGVRSGERTKIDVSTLDDESEYDSDEDTLSCGDADVEDILGSIHQLHLPTRCTPTGMIAKAALESRSRSRMPSPDASAGRTDSDGEDLAAAEGGIGNLSYFEPGPSANLDLRRLIIERQAAPEILLSGLVANEDVGKLFDIYWKWINPLMPILDEDIHTPASVLGRCPFLFTVVCAVASRFYDEKPHMYSLAIHIAKTAAANTFLDGWKTVEMCQAYALMAAYMPSARRWDEDRTWFYSGIAFRLAIDLDLGRPPLIRPTDERGEREVLNRLRTYIICYIVDRSFGINLGKPFMMPEVELIRNVNTMFLGSKYQHKADTYMASLVDLYRIMTRFMDIANPADETRVQSNSENDLISTHKVFAEELAAWEVAAAVRCVADEASKDPDDRLRMGLLHSCYQHCRLVTFSAGLHQVMKLNKVKEDEVFFTGCLHAGSAIINCVIERILPTGFLRYSPEHVFALSAFATAVLMKCLRPEFAHKLAPVQEERIVSLVKRLLQCLEDGQIMPGTDEQPTPRKGYSKFLQQLITSRIMERGQELNHAATACVVGKRKRTPKSKSNSRSHSEAQSQSRPTSQSSSPSLTHTTPAPAYVPEDVKPMEMMVDPHMHDMAFLAQWEAMQMPQEPVNTNPMLAFNEADYMQTFMTFSDQAWFMQ